jgi:hypothetical protein
MGASLFDIQRLIEYDAISWAMALGAVQRPDATLVIPRRGRATGVTADWLVLGIRERADQPLCARLWLVGLMDVSTETAAL